MSEEKNVKLNKKELYKEEIDEMLESSKNRLLFVIEHPFLTYIGIFVIANLLRLIPITKISLFKLFIEILSFEVPFFGLSIIEVIMVALLVWGLIKVLFDSMFKD